MSLSVGRIMVEAEDLATCEFHDVLRMLESEYDHDHIQANQEFIRECFRHYRTMYEKKPGEEQAAPCTYNPSPRVMVSKRRRLAPTLEFQETKKSSVKEVVVKKSGIGKIAAVLIGGSNGCMYIVDGIDGCVNCFQPNGTFCHKWTVGSVGADFVHDYQFEIGLYDTVSAPVVTELNGVPEIGQWPPGLASLCGTYVGEEYIYVGDLERGQITVYNMYGMRLYIWPHLYDRRQFCWTVSAADGLVYMSHWVETEKAISLMTFLPSGTVKSNRYLKTAGVATNYAMWAIAISDINPHLIFVLDNTPEINGYNLADGSIVHLCDESEEEEDSEPHHLIVNEGLIYFTDLRREKGRVFNPDGSKLREFGDEFVDDFRRASEPHLPFYFITSLDNTLTLLSQ